MVCRVTVFTFAFLIPSCACATVVRGSAFLESDSAGGDRMRPEVVAKTLARVEEEWKEQATAFTECNATADKAGCDGAPHSFAKSCSAVVSAVVQGSAGQRNVVSEYMASVCSQKTLANWQKLRCTDLANAIVTQAMSADSYANREKLNPTKLCASFWSKFVDEERKREAQEALERAAREKKEAEEAAAAKKKAEEEAAAAAKKAQEEAKAEAERRVKEEARKAREAKEQEAKRKAEEAKAKAAEAAARLAQKKAEAEAVQKAAQQKLEEASKAEQEHLQLQAEHKKAEELLRNAKQTSTHTATNATVVAGTATEHMHVAAREFMEVNLGPFGSAAEACDYCFSSFTKEGQPPAGPVAPFCVCMAYPKGGKYNMFCATPPSAAEYIAKKNGCRCKAKDMEAMGKTTCKKI